MLKKFINQSRTITPIFSRSHTLLSKIKKTADEATANIKDGASLMVGGFGLCGIPENLIASLVKKDVRDLTVVSNNCGVEDFGLGLLLHKKQIKRMIGSYVGENHNYEKQYFNGDLEVELLPQGTMAERVRAAGAGIPAFYTPAGYGTIVQKGGFAIKLDKDGKTPLILSESKETRVFNGRPYVMEQALHADFALIKGYKADTRGNVIFRRSARNFNPDFAQAARYTIAEVEEIVPAGQLDPDEIHLPGIYVDCLIQGEKYEKRIEKLALNDGKISVSGAKKKSDTRIRIGTRAAKEIKNGMYVNLGIGIPTLIPNLIDPSMSVEWQSEIGLLGIGPYPRPGEQDPDVINAGKETITTIPGSSFFSSSQSFSIMRGHHLDLTIIGGMQVSRTGDLANWIIPGKMVKGMGGAMDLVTSGSPVIVVMEHKNKNGEAKIMEQCTLPLTGFRVVSKLVTDMAVFEFKNHEMYLKEIAKEYSLEDVKKATACDFHIVDNLGTF